MGLQAPDLIHGGAHGAHKAVGADLHHGEVEAAGKGVETRGCVLRKLGGDEEGEASAERVGGGGVAVVGRESQGGLLDERALLIG